MIRAGERGAIREQLVNARATAKSLVAMIKQGWDIVITHGNGPQAGAALLRSERAVGEVYRHTLDMCVATTQSEIGYILQRALAMEFRVQGVDKLATVIPTMVAVDHEDPAYKNPSKPIGPFYEKEDAEVKKRELGWDIVEDAARGYRRVVPSPEPMKVLELEVIRKTIDLGIITIACGGGGIPVIIRETGEIEGSEAVIDKDRSSALLAKELDVYLFIISTDTDKVYLNFKTPEQEAISEIKVDKLEEYLNEGQFPPGSMGPKVESAIRFVRNSGKKAIITSFECLSEALEGKQGTHVVP